MLPIHIDRAIKENCPASRKHCVYVALGCCPAVEMWRKSHKSLGQGWMVQNHADYQMKVRVNV